MTANRSASVGLASILLIAAYLRLHNIDFGLPSLWDDDEPFFLMHGLKLLKAQTLNPGWFGHPGTTTIYLIALCTMLVYVAGWLAGAWTTSQEFLAAIYADPAIIMVPQRLMIVLPGLITIWLVYRIGRVSHSISAGLIAAAILAISPLHIELSQIVRTDVQMTMFVVASVYLALPLRDGFRLRPLLGSACFAGLACATKWPGIIILAVPVSLVLTSGGSAKEKVHYIATALFAALAALLVASPYILLDYRTVLGDVLIEGRPRHLSQTNMGVFDALGSYLFDILPNALGVPTMLLAAAGLVMSLTPRWRPRFAIPLATPALLFLALISVQAIMWPRWAVPTLPFLSLLAAIAAVELFRRSTASQLVHRSWPIAVLAVLTLLVPVAMGALDGARERSTETRDEALRWIARNVPAGSSVAVETPAMTLLRGPWDLRFPLGDIGCVDPRKAIAGGVDYDDVHRATAGRININLGTISPATIASCRADFIMVNELDRYIAESAHYQREIATYRALLAGSHEVARFVPRSGQVGGPIVRIYAH